MGSSFKKNQSKIRSFIDIGILLMVEKGIKEWICHSVNWHAKSENKYMKDYDKNKELSYIQYWNANNLYDWAISQKPLINNFEWIKDTFQFNEGFIKSYNKESDTRRFLEVDV